MDVSSPYGGMLVLLALLLFGYLLGSIPFGLLLTRMAGLGDIRSVGSGNIGATNVLRTGNRWLAALTLLLDGLKATAPALIGALFGPLPALAGGFGAFLGHLFPVWLGFKGGKGVATYVGVLLGLAPMMVLLFAVVWIAVAAITRYSSLAALVTTVVVPLTLFFLGRTELAIVLSAMTLISYYKHRTNISRLIAGTESRIGAKG